MKILDSKFMKGFIKMADDGFQQGWHERNGGNLSYRLKAEEVEMHLASGSLSEQRFRDLQESFSW